MRTRFIADLNPAYPSKGERRYAIFRVECGARPAKVGQSASLRQAERTACKMQVRNDLKALGIGFGMEGVE